MEENKTLDTINEEKKFTLGAEDVTVACDFVVEFCEELKKRPARLTATEDETATARLIRDRLHSETNAKVRLEAYKAHPLEGRGSIVLFGLWYAFCFILYLCSFVSSYTAGTVLTLCSLLLFLSGGTVTVLLFLGKGKRLNRILPRKVSYNVVSVREPSVCERGKERTVIICSGHDSVYGGYVQDFAKYRKITIIAILVSVFVFIVMCIVKMSVGLKNVASITVLSILPFLFAVAGVFAAVTHFSLSPKNARDNGGVATSITLATYAYFVEHPDLLPNNVRIVFASFGGENAAHGGSNAFTDAHPEFYGSKALCIGDILSGEFTVPTRDAIRRIAFGADVISAIDASAVEQGVKVAIEEFKTAKDKFNCLHGYVSNAFAKSNVSSATVLAKNYNSKDSIAVCREDIERLFTLSVATTVKLMEEQRE